MREFENNVQFMKYSVLKEVAKAIFNESLEQDLLNIPETIIKGPKPRTRCCIYKERAIITERTKLALGGNSSILNHVEVIDLACDDCPVNKYIVTDACRGCLAHKCSKTCKFDAIDFIGQKAHIASEKCKECGKCMEVCPYNAIVEVKRPCINACSANAIIIDTDTKKASIDYDKCIQCGACVYQCPFGALMDKSYIKDIIYLLIDSNHNKTYKTYAIMAPSISSQFTYASIGQVITGIKKLGFHNVVEAALGADIIAWHEAKQVSTELDELSFMTSSCCPSFVNYIEKVFPELSEHISKAVSPMIAAGRLIKQTDPNARIVFIGPCIGKKMEIEKDGISNTIDYVMTFEELQALLDARDIDIEKCEESPLDNASYFGRIFARSGGVSDAILHVAESESLDITIQPVICNGLKECHKNLTLAKFNKLIGNFIEGMACKGGCICGPASLSHGPKDKKEVDKYANLSHEKDIKDSLRILDIDKLKLDIE